ncbi:hypothetical protein EGW08_003449 [Elysia chlorotica]|uniref:Catechol O-methyltransferase n=1 Tax=Elysia chlorotica TaxID=188477 RepID=A0A3S1BQ50_ELYCH|nr:hypothetical protein EGW08_003449 [Elysia chlorotica]
MAFKSMPARKLDEAIKLAEATGVGSELMETLIAARDMFQRRDDFTGEATSDHSKTLAKIEHGTYHHDWQGFYDQGKIPWVYRPTMFSGRLEGQFLKSLVSIHKPKRILEVGLFTGYGALSMAEALPADGEVVSLEICESLKTLAEELCKESHHAKKIRVEVGPAMETVKRFVAAGEKFDMMFLDGDKKDYLNLVKVAFDENLLSEDGTVLVDNAYFIGGAYNPDHPNHSIAMEFLKEVKSRPQLHYVMLPMNDGIMMIRRMKDVEREAA